VDAAAVGQAGVEARALVGERAADELGHVAGRREQSFLAEDRLGPVQLALALDPDLARSVDQHLGDLGVVEEAHHGLQERSETVVEHRHAANSIRRPYRASRRGWVTRGIRRATDCALL
jgi:hypothetical protein